MDKYFVCLANSYKHGGRCIAGIEMQVTSAGYNVVRENGRPKWIRPICRYTDTGAIPNEIALNLQLFSIVRMTNVVPCPAGAQSENAFFDELQPIGVSFEESKIQDCLVDNSKTTLFFNHGKAVVPDVYNRLGDHSILLIKASEAEIYGDTTYTDYPRYRVRFCYHSHEYDLPITDPWYIHDIRDGKKTPGQKGDIFITCSLGVEHEGWHPKLAACVIEPVETTKTPVKVEGKAYSVEEVRKTHSQAYAKWTPEADAELARLFDMNWSIKQLMEHFGRNDGAIRSRLRKIGKME